MIQFLILSIILFSSSLNSKDFDIKLELVNENSQRKQIAEKYRNQKNPNIFTTIATNYSQNNSFPQIFYDENQYKQLVNKAMLEFLLGTENFNQMLNEYHIEKYGVSREFLFGSKSVHGLYKSRDFYEVANWIIDNKNSTHEQAKNVWNGYCKTRHVGKKDKELNRLRIEEEYNRRNKQLLLKKQRQEKEQENLELQRRQEEQKLHEIYNINFLNSNDYQSPYQNARKNALQKTETLGYKKYEQNHYLNNQTIELCVAKNIDYTKLQNCVGTAMQHQLYDEVADCYKKIAKFFCHPCFCQSLLAQQSLEFAQQVTQATELEAIELAIALSDLSHVLADTASSIFSGVKESIQDISQVLKDPIASAKNLGICVGKVLNYIAESMLYADDQNLGYQYYSQVLEKEHEFDAIYANAIIDNIKKWIKNSSGQEKIQVASKFVTDSILYPKFISVLSKTGKTCCNLISQVPEIQFLKEFSDIYLENKLATNLVDVGINNMQDLAMSFMENEKNIQNKIINQYKKHRNNAPKEVDTRCLLEKNLIIVEKAQYISVRIRKLSNGIIRFYNHETPASTPGLTKGSCHVTEYNPNKGIVRAWRESYDHIGNVNRVHPKMINGNNITSLHYPHTGKELFKINKGK